MRPDVAVSRTNTAHPSVCPSETEALHRGVARVARQLLLSSHEPALSDSDRHFLYDVASDDLRYPMRALTRIIAISRQAEVPAVRYALSELVRELSTPATQRIADVYALSHAETQAEAEANLAMHQFETFKDEPSRRSAVDRLRAHAAWIRTLLDTLTGSRREWV